MLRKLVLVALVLVLGAVTLLAAPDTASAQSYTTYVVQPGDSLSKIAARYCTTWQEIYNMNYQAIGPDPSVVEPGTVLTVVNRCGGGGGGGGSTGGVYDRGPSTHATGSYSQPYYTVAWGDTLTSVAARFGVSVDALMRANNLTSSTIYPGQVLLIPGAGGGQGPQPPSNNAERVTFSPGAIAANRVGQITYGRAQELCAGRPCRPDDGGLYDEPRRAAVDLGAHGERPAAGPGRNQQQPEQLCLHPTAGDGGLLRDGGARDGAGEPDADLRYHVCDSVMPGAARPDLAGPPLVMPVLPHTIP